jgi:hypothetical protein
MKTRRIIRALRLTFVVLAAVGLTVPAFATEPERTVKDNVITSQRDPAVRVKLPAHADYVGADRWDLLGIADCELHAFVKADAQKNAQRIYWVQFEQYLPSKPDLHHTYDSPRHANVGGLDFYVDTALGTSEQKPKPDSDGEHIRTLVAQHGYKWPKEFMYVRFVHLLDEAKRKELMIIYGEDLSATGFSVADLQKGGKAHDRWAEIEEEFLERARQAITILPGG